MLPVFAVLAGALAYPLASGLLLSLRRTTGRRPGEFVGLDNYVEALFRDDIFHQAVGNTVAFTAVAIVLQTGVGLLLAVLISEVRRGRLPYRMIFFAPVVLSAVAVGSVWKWMYAPYFGPVHQHCRQPRAGRRVLLAAGQSGDRAVGDHGRFRLALGGLQHGDLPGRPAVDPAGSTTKPR